MLRKIADAIAVHKEALAKKEAINAGKPLIETRWDIDDVSTAFRFNADLAEALDKKQGKPVDVGMEEFDIKLFYEPVGVVGCM